MTRQQTPWFTHPFVLSLVLIFTGVISFSLLWRIVQIVHQDTKPNIYQEHTQQLQKEVNDLKYKLEQQSEPFYQESIIRDQLNMKKPEEVILQLPTDTSESTP